MNVCKNCVHFINKEPSGPRSHVWYNHLCGASPLPEVTNPVTGETGYKAVNSLGMEIVQDNPYHYCRDINTDGTCEKFESDLSDTAWDELTNELLDKEAGDAS